MQQEAVDASGRTVAVIAPSEKVFVEACVGEGMMPGEALHVQAPEDLHGLSHRRIRLLLAEGAEQAPVYRSRTHKFLLKLGVPQKRVGE